MMTTNPSGAAPIACTLAAGGFKERLAWIADLNRISLRSQRRDDLRLHLTYAPEALTQVHEMVRRERECCAFLTFDVREETDAIRLIIEAPEIVRETADAVFEPFLGAGLEPSTGGCGGSAPQ